MDPQWFVTHACRALPEQIRAIVLYGSAATGDFVPGKSHYDLLVVAEQLGMAELRDLAAVVRPWRQAGHPLPLLFTPEQLAASADAFALEFEDMLHARKVLYGEDPIAGLTIDPAHVRLHLERELKGKALGLRDRYVMAAGDRARLIGLLAECLSTFLVLFRAALRLFRPQAPVQKLAALRLLAQDVPFDPQPFLIVAEIREGQRSPRQVDAESLFAAYLAAIDAVTHAVDQKLQAHS
jgi:predicted nucleotidyltransferase